MAIIDVITFNGEYDLFDLHYNILKDYVDEFIVVEFDKTFSGKEKPWYFDECKEKYTKVKYCKVTEDVYNKYKELAESSPNTEYGKGAEHWIREFCQKESIKDCLTHLKDEDVVFIGDCDEIYEPGWFQLSDVKTTPTVKAKLRVYTYWLNNRSSEEFWGTLASNWGTLKNLCLNHVRTTPYYKTERYCGWHFTSMGGFEAVKKKLEDSYAKETYAADEVIEHLEDNIMKQRDFLGRKFTYTINESEWPQYLKDNREKYAYLCK